MNTPAANPLHDIARKSSTIALVWLALVLYLQCYWLFDHWHCTTTLTDKLLLHFQDTGWLRPVMGRCIALFFLGLSFAGPVKPAAPNLTHRALAIQLGLGLLGYFGASLVFARGGDAVLTCCSCIAASALGYYLLHQAARQLVHLIPPASKEDPFGRQQAGFPQQENRVGSEFSLHLPGEYEYKGEKKPTWINLLNPRRGILILGSPGSGKSRFIIEPLLRQWMEKGHPLFLYDFKYDTLTRLAWEYFGRYRSRFPPATEFYCLNFGDLAHSHRCNLLDPSTLEWISDAMGISRTIFLSMNNSWVEKQGEFFVESPINFFAAVIWWLRKYQDGRFCTLPHAIELAQLPYDKLFTLLNTEPDIQPLINPFIVAFRNKTFEMLDSQITSAKIPLARLASPNLYYILTGNDLNLRLNDPDAPKICCLGADPARMEALGPILSLCIDRVNTLCNRPNRTPLAIVCDEFASVRAYSMATTIATGRSNNIVPILSVQDSHQLRTRYSREEAETFLTITGNCFCGQVGGETADWVSKRFPRIQRDRITVFGKGDSLSTTTHWEPTITAATIATLSAGEFVGIVADDPDNPLDSKIFHARLRRQEADGVAVRAPLPQIHKVGEKQILEVFRQVQADVRELTDRELAKVVGDTRLTGVVVK